MWSLLVFQFHYIGEFSSGPVLGFSWYWIQICWKSVPGVTINFPCDQAPGWMTEFRNIKFLTRTKSLKQKFTQRKARKSTKFRHINPIKPDFEDSSGALMIMMLLVDFAHRIV